MSTIQITITAIFTTCTGLTFSASDVGLTPTQMIENHGYVSETHHITTEDGYILTYHRIPTPTKRPAVLLQHGLLSSSADFVNMGPNRSLAYLLADAGYDVWLGNARGNAFSRNHTTLDVKKDKKEFFDFSWHEIGYYDNAAAIDYILALNGDDSLYYIGHSQGTTAFFVLASTRPEYNKKIKVAHMLAPSTYMAHYKNSLSRVNTFEQVVKVLYALRIYEIPGTKTIRSFATKICGNSFLHILCDVFLAILNIADLSHVDSDKIAVITTNAPSNAALKLGLHFAQSIKSGRFAQYDYGILNNMAIYGTAVSPNYDISKVTTPVALYYATNDGVQAPEDVETLKSQLSNLVNDYLVPWEPFNHFDFLFERNVVSLVYNELFEINKNY